MATPLSGPVSDAGGCLICQRRAGCDLRSTSTKLPFQFQEITQRFPIAEHCSVAIVSLPPVHPENATQLTFARRSPLKISSPVTIRQTQHRWLPKYLSCDHDRLYRFHQWQANLRILEVTEIKSIPYVPLSHPFVERLIGTLRREYLDHMLFWTTADLENKLLDFRSYFNHHRTHTSREGRPPDPPGSQPAANLSSFRWQPHCRALYQTPVAA